jgi:hypothetical protein
VATLTPQQITTKWQTNYSSSGPAMTDGSNAVTEAPGVAAAAQKNFWLSQIQASANKWATNVAAVTLQQWKTAYQTLGITRGQAGAQAKSNNYLTFITAYMAWLPSQVQTIKNMPKGGIANAIARSSAMIQASYQWGQARA